MFEMADADAAAAPQQVAETRSEGKVGGKVFMSYFNATGGGVCSFFFVFILFVLSQGFASGGDYWLTYWQVPAIFILH